MNKKLRLIIFIFCVLNLRSYSEMDIGLYSFEFNKKIRTSGTKVYIDESGEVYVELQNFLHTIGITNNSWIDEKFYIDKQDIYGQEKIINLSKKVLETKNEKIPFKYEIKEGKDKIYVKLEFLEKLLNIKKLEKDDDKLRIEIETGFRLPLELSNIREYKKEELKNKKEVSSEKIRPTPKFFEPGNLRGIFNYRKNFQASNYENKYLDAEYLGPLLYGDLETYYSIYPDLKNNQTRLTYRDIYTDHSLIYGDTGVNLPRALGGTVGSLRGISFKRIRKLYGEENNNSITISGLAPLGKFVELYRNGDLVSYEDVKNGGYVFRNVPLTFSSDSFYVIIYNADGSIQREYLNRFYGEELEKKGEFGFNIQVGQSRYDKYDQIIGEVNYGLTNDITLKFGQYNLKYNAFYSRENPQEDEITKIGFLHSSLYTTAPYMIEGDLYRNEKDEYDYTLKYGQIYKDYRFEGSLGKYSSQTEKRLNRRHQLNLEITKTNIYKNRVSASVKYAESKYPYGNEYKDIGSVVRVSFNNFIPEYGLYKDLVNGDIYHDLGVRSYYFRNYAIFAGVSHRTIDDFNESKYKVEIMRRYQHDSNVRYRAYYEKSNRYGDIFGIAFELDYDTWFSGSADYTKSSGRSSMGSGFTLDKVISLSDVESKVTSVENNHIRGRVFIDSNGNGIYDKDEEKVLPKTKINVMGKDAYTDENGLYKVMDLYPGSIQEVKITTQNPIYKGKVEKYKVYPNPATIVDLDVPMYRRKEITGNINFSDEMLREKYLKTYYIIVIDKTTNEQVEVVIPETDGFFLIENLINGDYQLRLESVEDPGKSLMAEDIKIGAKCNEIDIQLNIGGKYSEKNESEMFFNIDIIGLDK